MLRLRLFSFLFLAVFAGSGCATTSITSLVSPSAPRYGVGQILVVAAYGDLGWRRDVETGFRANHPSFVASVDLLDVGSLNDVDAIIARFRSDSTLEGLLLIGPKGAGLSQSFMVSQYYTGSISKPWANTSATLYDGAEAKIVWQADASTGGNAYASWSDIRNSFIGKIIDQLHNDGLLSDSAVARRTRRAVSVAVPVTNVAWRRSLPSASEVVVLTSQDFNLDVKAKSVFDRVSSGVVRLEGDRGLGTAFLISRDGLALSNHHVVSGQSGMLARFSDNRTVPFRVVRSDEQSDVALIQLHCEVDCVTVPLGSESEISTGSDVYALGHPVGLTATLTKGIVSGVRLVGGVTLLQVDAALNAGNSGGPIIDAKSGKVVAVVSFKVARAEGLGFGIAIDDALRVLGVRLR